MDVYFTASQFGKLPGLATSTSVNNCYLFFIFVVPVTDITSSIDVEVVRFVPEVNKTAGIAKKELKVG